MFGNIKVFDNNLVLLILCILFVLFIIAFLVYFIISSRKTKKFIKNSSNEIKSNEYTFKFDFSNDLITMYHRTKDVMYRQFRFAEFKETVIKDQRNKFDDWLEHIKTNKKKTSTTSFAIKIPDLFDNKHRWIRFTVINYKKRRMIIYCHAVGVSSYRKEKMLTNDIINLNMFKLRVEESCYDSKLEGTIYCINCNMLDFIRRRYGQEVANQYLVDALHSFHALNNLKTLAGHYKNDSFLIYKPSSSKSSIQDNLKKILQVLDRYIEFDQYQFEIKPTSGAAIIGEFPIENLSPVSAAIEQAYKASLKSYGDVVVYDMEMDLEEQAYKQNVYNLESMIEGETFYPSFYRIIGLDSGDYIGYFSEINYDRNKANIDFNKNESLRKRFNEAIFKMFLKSYIDNEYPLNKKLFIFMDIDMLDVFEEVYDSDKGNNQLNVVAVINSYTQVLEADVEVKNKLQKMKHKKIQLGVVAEESMQKIVHPFIEYMDYVILPDKMIKLVGIDERMKLCVGSIIELIDNKYNQLNIQTIAWNVTNVSQAEILKSLGIINMNGPLFDSRSRDGSSIRRINKLMEDN